ncbi:LysR family transcriptional regulator [Neorhizobium sp. 2083]|uniref:LysR family transcriptional regulator n=1 Tax=Neorhizobium sp. 2083 TaxID=2817762 RepID=UPI0038621305
MGRAQSVVSQTIANLEAQLGARLFDRIGRYPELTPHGTSLLVEARRVVNDAESLKGGLLTNPSPTFAVIKPIH